MTESASVGTKGRPLRVAVVGSGPAGFYAADALLKAALTVQVDVFERLPTPFGLVRGGVAPDHQSVKKVVRMYEKTAGLPGFRFFGNVELGRDVSVDELSQHYDQLVYAVGNESSRRLGIPGEGMLRSIPAAVFIGWYNGHPDYRNFPIDFSRPRAAVVGNGNVALDISRILLSTPEALARTDIADYALEALKASRIREVVLLGHHGPVQATFTHAELRELTELEGVASSVDATDVELDPLSARDLEQAQKAVRRNYERLAELAHSEQTAERRVQFRFAVSAVEVLGGDDNGVRSIKLARNRRVQQEGSLDWKPSGETETLETDMLFTAIGYRGKPIEGVPFDDEKGRIVNDDGRVLEALGGAPQPNRYVVGWARSGPTGRIGMHKAASAKVVAQMLDDVAADNVPARELPDRDALAAALRERNCPFVTFDDWRVLDAIEVERGKRRDAPRAKVTAVEEMLDLAGKR